MFMYICVCVFVNMFAGGRPNIGPILDEKLKNLLHIFFSFLGNLKTWKNIGFLYWGNVRTRPKMSFWGKN